MTDAKCPPEARTPINNLGVSLRKVGWEPLLLILQSRAGPPYQIRLLTGGGGSYPELIRLLEDALSQARAAAAH